MAVWDPLVRTPAGGLPPCQERGYKLIYITIKKGNDCKSHWLTLKLFWLYIFIK